MDFCIARQPIFNFNKQLHAYELLYRGNGEWNLSNTEGSRATSSLLSSTFMTEGIEKITGSKPCFVNFTQELLLKNIHQAFPKNRLVIEILEDVEATAEVVAACRQMVAQGYTLALDDFIYHPKFDPLIELASIIKVDFLLTPVDSLAKMLHKLSRLPLMNDVKIALVDDVGPYAPVLNAVKNYEQSLKEPCLENLKQVHVKPQAVGRLYLQAVEYGEELLVDC